MVGNVFGFGLGAKLCPVSRFAGGGELIALHAVEEGHVGADLDDARGVALNAAWVTVGVGKAAACEDFRAEGVKGHLDALRGLLFVKPCENHVGVLP